MRPAHPAPAARRALVLAAAGSLVIAACGGSDDSSSDAADAPTEVADAPEASGADAGDAAAPPAEAVPARVGPGLLDLVGPEIQAASNTEINPLPDVVVDDLTNGRKVNFRNLVPQDKPVLLWMYAPH